MKFRAPHFYETPTGATRDIVCNHLELFKDYVEGYLLTVFVFFYVWECETIRNLLKNEVCKCTRDEMGLKYCCYDLTSNTRLYSQIDIV